MKTSWAFASMLAAVLAFAWQLAPAQVRPPIDDGGKEPPPPPPLQPEPEPSSPLPPLSDLVLPPTDANGTIGNGMGAAGAAALPVFEFALRVNAAVLNEVGYRKSPWLFVVSYEDWSLDILDGTTWMVTGGYDRFTDPCGWGVLVPAQFLDADGSDLTEAGVLPYIYRQWKALRVGAFVEGDHTWSDIAGVEDDFSFGVGGFATYLADFRAILVGLGTSWMYWDSGVEGLEDMNNLIAGPKVTVPVGPVAIDLFGYWVNEFENDAFDDAWFELGGIVNVTINELWSLVAGYQRVEDFEDLDSDRIFLGVHLNI